MRPEDYPEEVQRCLRVVWLQSEPSRYVPRAIGEGPGWQVWDRKLDRPVVTDSLADFTYEQITEDFAN